MEAIELRGGAIGEGGKMIDEGRRFVSDGDRMVMLRVESVLELCASVAVDDVTLLCGASVEGVREEERRSKSLSESDCSFETLTDSDFCVDLWMNDDDGDDEGTTATRAVERLAPVRLLGQTVESEYASVCTAWYAVLWDELLRSHCNTSC